MEVTPSALAHMILQTAFREEHVVASKILAFELADANRTASSYAREDAQAAEELL